MDTYLGLEGVKVTGGRETHLEITLDAELETSVACPRCPNASFVRHQTTFQQIADVPSRGKKVRIIVLRHRYRCKSCNQTFMQPFPDWMAPRATTTKRLLRYIETQGCHRTITGIAREVGVSETKVENQIRALAERLFEFHRFQEPYVLGIDDLRLRRRLYTVLTDGNSGRAVALVEGGKELDVVRELNRRGFDRDAVKIIVSDLGKTNIAIAKKEFGHALHVADKWHVLNGANDALSKVINQEVNGLRKSGKQDQAKAIVAVKRVLMRGETEIKDNGFQLSLGLDKAGPILMQHPRIGKAFWAKMRLYRAYQSKDAREAIKHGIRFYR